MSMAVTMMMFVVMLVMTMIVAAVFVMAMILRMVMTMPGMAATGISAAFRIERRFNDDHARTKTAHHVLDHMIAPDAQALSDNLRRKVAVAEMPCDPHQMMRIGAPDFHQRFGCCDHFDHSPVFQHQCIAAAQGDGFFQIQQEF